MRHLSGKDLVVAALIFCVALGTFAATLGHEFVWDDQHLVFYARQVSDHQGPGAIWTVPFLARPDDPSDTSGYYRPLTFFTMLVNDPRDNPAPIWFHLFNVVLHSMNAVLVWFFLRLLMPEGAAAFLGGLLFAVHPVHAESVAFVSGRTDLLAAFFTLLAAIWWYRSRDARVPWRWQAYLTGLLFFGAACLSKEVSFVLPALFVLWGPTGPGSHGEDRGRVLSRDMAWFAGAMVVLGVILFLRLGLLGIPMGPGWSAPALADQAGPMSMILGALENTAQYLRLMLFPWPLSVYYPPSPPGMTMAAALAAGVFLSACALVGGRKYGYTGYRSLTWVLLFIAPVSGIVGLGSQVIAERFCYLPSVGVCMVGGFLLGQLWSKSRFRRAVPALVTALVLTLGLTAARHSNRWADEVTFFENAAAAGPSPVPNMYFNLGNAYVKAGRPREGLEAFEEAVRLRPDYPEAMLNMASTLISTGDHDRAFEVLEKAKELNPGDARIWSNLGVVLGFMGRSVEALDAYERSSALDRRAVTPRLDMGHLLLSLERYDEAVQAYREVLSIDSSHHEALLGLGKALEGEGMYSGAAEAFLEAVEAEPEDIASYLHLGRVFLEQERPREAGVVYRNALVLDPGSRPANRGAVIAALASGNLTEAGGHIERLRKLDPRLAEELEHLFEAGSAGEGTR